MLRRFVKFKFIIVSFCISVILIMSGFLLSYFSLAGTTQPLILHFNDDEGITWRGGAANLIGIAWVALVAAVLNFLIALELELRDKFFGRLVAVSTICLSVLIFWYFWVILSIN